ncbi:uncharacterized protein [Diabrotica undecimpunctata]|uniref:uncharacterized protein n=1 Tax=Diabrotica undecimpunctata TaxID=50387 RepID=UPI003B635013
MNINQENCRLCQIYIGTVPLNEDLSQIIFDVTRIKVNDQYHKLLPVNICAKCNTTILETNTYLKGIQRVNSVLLDYLENTKIKVNNNSLPINENSEINNCDIPFNNTGDTPNINVLHDIESLESHVCPICSQKFSRKTNYIKHKRKHPQLYCTNCHTFFEQQVESQNHICKLHIKRKKVGVKIKVELKSEDIKDTEYTSDYQYQCNTCLKQCVNRKSYKTHIQTHEKFTCDEENCSKVYASLYSLKTHKLIHEGKRPFLCVVCGKDFISKKSLICHEKIHSIIKGYHCDLCNVGFSIRSNLRAHIKKYHECIRFHCSQCPKEFMTKCTLDRHEKTHAGIKEFKCHECTSAFYTKRELIKHQRYHQGIKLHKCEQCFKTFFERHHLITHIRSHNGERPFVCAMADCAKSFYDKQKLRRHERTVHSVKKVT